MIQEWTIPNNFWQIPKKKEFLQLCSEGIQVSYLATVGPPRSCHGSSTVDRPSPSTIRLKKITESWKIFCSSILQKAWFVSRKYHPIKNGLDEIYLWRCIIMSLIRRDVSYWLGTTSNFTNHRTSYKNNPYTACALGLFFLSSQQYANLLIIRVTQKPPYWRTIDLTATSGSKRITL